MDKIKPARFLISFALTLAAFYLSGCGGARSAVHQSSAKPTSIAGWTLVWSDEFDQRDGSAPNNKKWTHEIGGGGWGNNELETYTTRRENARIEDGKLVITARRESFTGSDGKMRDFTSARIRSKGKFSQAYGRFEARIKIPFGQGIWPAFWMLGDDHDSAGWPDCGEIDIMENIGKEPGTIHGTIHGPGYSGDKGIGAPYSLAAGRFADAFHIFAVEWEPEVVRFYTDGSLYETITPTQLPAARKWIYDHPFFVILNLAVGGYWPGNPDESTIFPQTMQVDYVRVYRREQ